MGSSSLRRLRLGRTGVPSSIDGFGRLAVGLLTQEVNNLYPWLSPLD
jgi:hypothetical protein